MKNKKIISLILAIVICLTASILVVTANAKNATVEIFSDKTELSTGESTTVSVKVTTNFPVATMSIPVFYNKTLVSVSDAQATLTDYSVKNTTIDFESADASKIYDNTNINKDDYGFILVNYIGSAGSQVPENINGVVLTFTITAKENVDGNALINCVSESVKTSDNVAGMLYFGAAVNGRTIDAIPENVENIDLSVAAETITITKKAATPNTLILNENAPFEAIIDTTNNCDGEYTGTVYGFDTLGWNDNFTVDGAIADFVTTAYGDDYLEVVTGDAGVETTGTVINVLDTEGNVVESYIYVYFGDIDMDGNVGTSDAGIAEYYEGTYDAEGAGIHNLAQYMAGDLDGDSYPGVSDAIIMENWEGAYEGMAEQSVVATNIVDKNIIYEIV